MNEYKFEIMNKDVVFNCVIVQHEADLIIGSVTHDDKAIVSIEFMDNRSFEAMSLTFYLMCQALLSDYNT